MLALYIIFGIFAFITLILSINFIIVVDYDEILKVHAKWLFFKIPLFPKKEDIKKKDKKQSKEEIEDTKPAIEKNEKEEKTKTLSELGEEIKNEEILTEKHADSEDKPVIEEESQKDESVKDKAEIQKEEKPKTKNKSSKKHKKQENPLLILYNNTGFDGIIDLLHHTVDALGGLLKGLYRHIVIREVYVDFLVTGKDAADTAIKYGSLCQKVFPAFGFICSNMKVLKYDIQINPDFLGGKNESSYYIVLSMKPLFLIWYTLVALIRLAFNVVLKVFLQLRQKKHPKSNNKKDIAKT